MVVILNFFDFDAVSFPLWIQILVGVFICACTLWTILVLYGCMQFAYGFTINGTSNSKNNARIEAMKKSLGITSSTLSIEADGKHEASHMYSNISMRKPSEYNENFEICSGEPQ